MRTRMLGALSAMALVVAGCGSGDAYDNASRPPSPENVSISLVGGRVMVSPDELGGGPVVLLIANESGRTRDVQLAGPDGGSSSCVESEVSSGPINPQGTARLRISLVEGECMISVADGELEPARLTVGPERPSAQDDLLEP